MHSCHTQSTHTDTLHNKAIDQVIRRLTSHSHLSIQLHATEPHTHKWHHFLILTFWKLFLLHYLPAVFLVVFISQLLFHLITKQKLSKQKLQICFTTAIPRSWLYKTVLLFILLLITYIWKSLWMYLNLRMSLLLLSYHVYIFYTIFIC